MKRVYIGNKELTTIATVTNGGGGGDDTQKWVDYFNGTLTEFTVPEGVKSINTATFNTFTGLTSLTLPSSIASIDRVDMHGMHGSVNPFDTLKTMTVKATTPPTLPDYEISIPTTIETIYVPKYSANIYKAIDGWNRYADKIQALPQNETVVTYNDGTTKKFDIKGDLTQTSIENKEAITKVLISDDVTSIGESAFAGCSSLTSIAIPNSVTSIGNSAFYNCSSLTSIAIPNSVTSIGNSAFYNCSSLTVVIIENSTSKLAYNTDAFGVISSNAKLYVPSNLLADYQADSNWSNAFGGGIYAVENIMKVTYTDGTEKTFNGSTAIKSDTDSNKKNTKNVVIYDTVSLINSNAFENCSSMSSVVIPDSIIYIGKMAFQNCSSLTSVVIPDSVTKIDYYAFYGCSGMTSITIPNSVTIIDFGAFEACSSLTGVIIENSTSKLTYNIGAFDRIASSAKLYVPSNLLADYQADSNWTDAFKGGIFAIQ